jgi:hypothetical protein
MTTAAANCDAAYAALVKHGPCGATKVQKIINSSPSLTLMALELLVSSGEIATTGIGYEKTYKKSSFLTSALWTINVLMILGIGLYYYVK